MEGRGHNGSRRSEAALLSSQADHAIAPDRLPMTMTAPRRSARQRHEAPECALREDPVAIERAARAAQRKARKNTISARDVTSRPQSSKRGATRVEQRRGSASDQSSALPADPDRNSRTSRGSGGENPAGAPSVPAEPGRIPLDGTRRGSAASTHDGSGRLPDQGRATDTTDEAGEVVHAPSSIAAAGTRAESTCPNAADGSAPRPPSSKPQASGSSEKQSEIVPGRSLSATAPSSSHADPCGRLRDLIQNAQQRVNREHSAPIEDPQVVGQPLLAETIWRAIAGVTEAVRTNGGGTTQFSLIDPLALDVLRFSAEPPRQIVARPGNETFLIRTDGSEGRSHHSLYFLRRSGESYFEMRSYDSASGNIHRRNSAERADELRQHLVSLGWDRSDPALDITPGTLQSEPRARQRRGWECGIYVILYAWSLALGLDEELASFSGISNRRQPAFVARAVELINLALAGTLSSEMIEAFLKCFDMIGSRVDISLQRRFTRTHPLRTYRSLQLDIARLRLQHDLDEQGSPSLQEMLEAIRRPDTDVDHALPNLSTDDIMLQYAMAASLSSGQPASRGPLVNTKSVTPEVQHNRDADRRDLLPQADSEIRSSNNGSGEIERQFVRNDEFRASSIMAERYNGVGARVADTSDAEADNVSTNGSHDRDAVGVHRTSCPEQDSSIGFRWTQTTHGDRQPCIADSSPRPTISRMDDAPAGITAALARQNASESQVLTSPGQRSEGRRIAPSNTDTAAPLVATDVYSNVAPDALGAKAQAVDTSSAPVSNPLRGAGTSPRQDCPTLFASNAASNPQASLLPDHSADQAMQHALNCERALSPEEDLFGEETDGASGDNDTKGFRLVGSLTEQQIDLSGTRSPSLALPPPTPRNTGSACFSLSKVRPKHFAELDTERLSDSRGRGLPAARPDHLRSEKRSMDGDGHLEGGKRMKGESDEAAASASNAVGQAVVRGSHAEDVTFGEIRVSDDEHREHLREEIMQSLVNAEEPSQPPQVNGLPAEGI